MLGMVLLSSLFSIIHSSDGAVDDFATTALIAAVEQKEDSSFNFPAVILTNADCEPISALNAYRKTLKLFNLSTEVGLSASRVATHFPWQWRLDSREVDRLPMLQNVLREDELLHTSEGNQLFAKVLKDALSVKIIATGPLTTIADVLRTNPELISKISELHWMGGALDSAGNIIYSPEIPKELLNEKAEWNVFCDPQAADWVFRNTSFPIYLYPLDVSDIPISNHFIEILKTRRTTPYAEFVAGCYKITENIEGYRMWDVVAAAGVLFPEVFELPVQEKLSIDVGVEEAGALRREDNGREVFVYKEFKNNDPTMFYEAVVNALTDI